MATRRQRARQGRGKGSRRGPLTTRALLGRALGTFFGSLPTIAAVILATALPTQLLLAWLYVRLGVEQDPGWQTRYAGIGDLVVGSLTIPAGLIAIRRCIEGPRGGVLATLRLAYGQAVGVWLGSFLTRLMVNFVVGVTALLPVLLGWLVARWLAPALRALETDAASALAGLGARDLALLAALPLLALPGLGIFLRYALADVVVALERLDGFAALTRSKALTAGARRRILVGVLAFSVPLEVAGYLASEAAPAVGVWVGALLSSAVLVAGALPAAFLVHVYREQAKGSGSPQDETRA